MNLEEIIKRSFDKLNSDIKLRNSLYLNIIHKNIDLLAMNCERWFGEDVPEEYIEVLNSLINFSIIISDLSRSSVERIFEGSFQKFSPLDIIEELRYYLNEVLNIKNFSVISDKSIDIVSSKNIFKDSLFHIFFCISQFMGEDSSSELTITKDHSTVMHTINFQGLSDNLPDVRTLLRLFITQDYLKKRDKNIYDIKIGLNIAVENIRRIGGFVKIDTLQSRGCLEIVISFPSEEFINTINDVRKYEIPDEREKRSGIVLLSQDDKIVELLITESLQNCGYKIYTDTVSKLKFIKEKDDVKALILDYDTYCRDIQSVNDLLDTIQKISIIVIHKPSDKPGKNNSIHFLELPFEIDIILDLID